MKKLFTLACGAVLAAGAITSCGSHGDASGDANDTAVSRAMIDSISVAQGTFIGNAILSNYEQIQLEGNVDKAQIIKGIQTVLAADKSRGTAIGMQFGLQMLREMDQLEKLGITVNRSKMIDAFKTAFMQDSVDQTKAQEIFSRYQQLVENVQKEKIAREEARIAASDEAVANVEAGKAHIAKLMSDDPAYRQSDSGVAYKIVAQGDTTKLNDHSRITVKYNERKLNGETVITTGESGRLAIVENLPAGLAEVVLKLGVGGKAELVAPGELAYGVRGLSHRNVGPNEALAYDVEVISLD